MAMRADLVGAEAGVGRVLFLHFFLLLFPHLLLTAGLHEVTSHQAAKQHNVHDGHDGQTHAADGVADQGDEVTIQHQPAGHPGQSVDAKHYIGAQVYHAVDTVKCTFGQAGHAEHLPQVQKDWIDLHQQSHHCKTHIPTGQHRDPETGDHLQTKEIERFH